MQSQRLIQHTGSAELTIEGKNLKDTLRLLHDGVEYTPLSSTDNSVTFLLGLNGTNRIYVNGEYSFGVQISGVVVPSQMNGQINMYQTSSSGAATGETVNNITVSSFCINYPYKLDDAHPYYRLHLYGAFEEEDINNVGYVNCESIFSTISSSNGLVVKTSILDATKPAYITFQGFIVAVFNYE